MVNTTAGCPDAGAPRPAPPAARCLPAAGCPPTHPALPSTWPHQTPPTSCLRWWCTWGRTPTTVRARIARRHACAGCHSCPPWRTIALGNAPGRTASGSAPSPACPRASLPRPSALSTIAFLLPAAGHYVALVKTPSGQWVCFDDEQVNAITEAQVGVHPFGWVGGQQGCVLVVLHAAYGRTTHPHPPPPITPPPPPCPQVQSVFGHTQDWHPAREDQQAPHAGARPRGCSATAARRCSWPRSGAREAGGAGVSLSPH